METIVSPVISSTAYEKADQKLAFAYIVFEDGVDFDREDDNKLELTAIELISSGYFAGDSIIKLGVAPAHYRLRWGATIM